MSAAGWPAPAKLNLFLHITARRADGMHELQTLFQFLDVGDSLYFTLREDGYLRLQGGLAGIADEDNLVMRAARRLQTESGTRLGADMRLEKRLPAGAGLGGGSSDAATTLVALNRLWQVGLSVDELARIGLGLGADVPVFVHGQAAWAEGVGEKFTAVAPPEPWYLVVAPSCEVSTAAIFAAPELTRDCRPITIRDFLSGQAGNVCEAVVREHYPAVSRALDWLGRFAPARMTGTGSCVFAAFENEAQATEVSRKIPGEWQGFVARGCNRSPLLDRLAAES
ncbi:4-(cytidine 5'-diphospho)-2-C-methyl-D-erythritol kinase [Sulfuriflexus sp.]|uniref:4-(cytidine 5'-diphospho)-2-C-methyl-D-erythritol kinase n=1 Tax=Sulfuriflexus sp. TaxID=2015443 RepID=UPI0028CE67FA|nr:4-(cytidine 5'-diphospho)-2-C-methyl-D-erythritol kinase [Sulfuriflexus sp.]MDT8404399.1 4-(cytidine 5'-diphospho)-2-C-methyl-D-erythritol kinase [Sulfuriflexus sp.]